MRAAHGGRSAAAGISPWRPPWPPCDALDGVYWRFGDAWGSCCSGADDRLVAHAFSPNLYGAEEVFEYKTVE